MFVEPGLFAGERGTLKTKIDTLLTETIPDMATFEQGTCLFAATVAFGFREIMQHHFETLVVFEDWFVEHGDEALGINIEVTQAFDEFGAVFLYVATVEGKAMCFFMISLGCICVYFNPFLKSIIDKASFTCSFSVMTTLIGMSLPLGFAR